MQLPKRAISDVYGELKETAKEVGLIINVDKTKARVQNRRLEREDIDCWKITRLKWSGDLNI